MSNLPNKCPKCGLPYCNPVGGRGACWEIDGNGCLERQIAAAVKEREEYRKRWNLVARDESDTIGEYIELEKNFAAVTAERNALKAKIDAARKYQDIVYAVCTELDRVTGRSVRTGSGLVADKDEIINALRSAILNDAREAGKD